VFGVRKRELLSSVSIRVHLWLDEWVDGGVDGWKRRHQKARVKNLSGAHLSSDLCSLTSFLLAS
jgi:hypothetical protein